MKIKVQGAHGPLWANTRLYLGYDKNSYTYKNITETQAGLRRVLPDIPDPFEGAQYLGPTTTGRDLKKKIEN